MPAQAIKPSLADRAEFIAAYAALHIFKLIGPRNASNLGGTLCRWIGPYISASKTADRNLAAAMPELTRTARRRIIAGTWENLGRTIAELVHIGSLRETPSGPGFRVTGAEHLARADGLAGPRLVLTGHIGNWEAIPMAVFARGVNLAFMYRAASNPLVDALIIKLRQNGMNHKAVMFAKGGAGARGAYAHLARNGNLCMLIDQKLDNGIAVPFFNMPAMTAPALAVFAMKFRCPIIPIHVVREGPARLHIICEKPLILPDTGNRQADTLAVMTMANEILERWIREIPSSWLWLHRRWPKATSFCEQKEAKKLC